MRWLGSSLYALCRKAAAAAAHGQEISHIHQPPHHQQHHHSPTLALENLCSTYLGKEVTVWLKMHIAKWKIYLQA